MIHRYAYPVDDECQHATPSVRATPEDPGYPGANLVLENPAQPAKLTATSGDFVLGFTGPVQIRAVALIYHNIELGATITLQGNDSDSWGSPGFSQEITLWGKVEDDWTLSPWTELPSAPTYRYWRLAIDGSANVYPISVGRLVLLSHLRSMTTDVRWGVEEIEEHGVIELATELGVETLYALGGKRRRFDGQLTLSGDEATEFLALVRRAQGRVFSWLLIPDATVNDAWLVRFDEPRWSRVREIIDINNFPFRVQELSRGLPWP